MAVAALVQYEDNDADEAADGTPQVKPFEGKELQAYLRMFTRAEEACAPARKLAHRDRDWHDNFDDNQWDDNEKQLLKKRKQPPVTSNRIKRKIGFMCGLEQKQRTDPKALPRNPNDTDSANIITQVLDYIETETRFDNTSSQSFRDLAIEGIEAVEVIVEDGDRIVINQLQYDGFFYDPRSKKRDFSDARYLGYQDWFDEDDVFDMFRQELEDPAEQQKADRQLREALSLCYTAGGEDDEGYDDKPALMWGDEDRKRVRIACMYWKGKRGAWNYVYFTVGGILKEGVSPYIDDKGKPDCAIIAASCFMTRKNERFGLVRELISPQRELNYRKSNALFIMKQTRTWARAPGILPKNASEELAKADGQLIAQGVKDVEWGLIDSSQQAAENFQLMQAALMEIDAQGPNAGLQGRGTENQSGRAIVAQQQSGLTEENDIYDTHNDWKTRIYRAMWSRAKQFWTEPKFIRVTDEEEAFRFIHLNQMQPVMDPMTGQPMMGPDGQPQMQPVPGTQIAEMDADIIVEATQDTPTLQHEEFAQLTDMAGKGLPIPPDAIIEASSLRDKRKIMKRVKEEAGAQGQLQKAGQQIEEMSKVIEELQKKLTEVMQANDAQTEAAKHQAEAAKAVSEHAKAIESANKTQADVRQRELDDVENEREHQVKNRELDVKLREIILKEQELGVRREEIAADARKTQAESDDRQKTHAQADQGLNAMLEHLTALSQGIAHGMTMIAKGQQDIADLVSQESEAQIDRDPETGRMISARVVRRRKNPQGVN